MRAAVIVLAVALAGCSTPEPVDRYKIIAVPVEKVKKVTRTKTVTVMRDCPALPEFNPAWQPAEVSAWQRTVIRMYKECAK
ncbi:hypothetical protein W822_19955 [Advenella kashmirensis W13003]|uniref:Lipoprotein n=1 Tax=Advenella kashmirensis W13003 TaxID=1424334 RepID=V8QNL2_9BURK|nr:hypothetical protein [Advenella kashmirensis]ETF00928.1 hypothetical protein W822_19955 [Advenella kashmirensis W13003]